jgi:catechol 2,3-dioxygenase-like lactoylglutathione lyase family enzyme
MHWGPRVEGQGRRRLSIGDGRDLPPHRSIDRRKRGPAVMITRGIDHVGITVPDVEAATAFFVDGFDAVVLYDLIVGGAMVSKDRQVELAPVDLSEILGVPRAAGIRSQRMLRLGNGPSLELFEYVNVAEGAERPSRSRDRRRLPVPLHPRTVGHHDRAHHVSEYPALRIDDRCPALEARGLTRSDATA